MITSILKTFKQNKKTASLVIHTETQEQRDEAKALAILLGDYNAQGRDILTPDELIEVQKQFREAFWRVLKRI